MSRFYPEFVPPFPHEPNPSNFAIRPIGKGVGEGVVALKAFEQGQIVFRFTGFYMSEQTLFTLQVEPGLFVHDPFFMGKVLHRCDPNCAVDMKRRQFTARRPIMPGEWITMNYETTEDELFRSFVCVCGDAPCEGFEPSRLIQGKKVGQGSDHTRSHSNGLSLGEQGD
jgi:uncharacterized protein